MLGILNNELINNPHIVDEKCSQTSITYPPSFTFHFWHLYMNPQAVFLFLRVLYGSLQCYFTQLKNGLINRVGHGERNYRGRFITYFPGLGLIFMVHDRLGISYYQFLQYRSVYREKSLTVNNQAPVNREKLQRGSNYIVSWFYIIRFCQPWVEIFKKLFSELQKCLQGKVINCEELAPSQQIEVVERVNLHGASVLHNRILSNTG